MAKITHGPTVSNARGKIGDTVFTKARGGNVAKALSVYGGLGDPVTIAHGGTGTSTPTPVPGDGISFSGTWPNQTISNTWGATHVTNTPIATNYHLISSSSGHAAWVPGPLAIALGGTATDTPTLNAGTGITITGSWPNNTIALTTPVTVPNGGTGTSTGSITGPGALSFAAGGSNQSITLTPSGGGLILLAAATVRAGTQTGATSLTIDGGAGSTRDLDFMSAGSFRWVFRCDGTAEGGANAGSDFLISRRADAGGHLGYPLFIRRSDGQVGIGTNAPKSALHVVGLAVYANNAAAVAGGLTTGAFYRTGGDPDPVCVVH
jgi:hypothetical protein